MTNAVFPGTFDPITLGHVDLIQRASRIFNHLTVAIAESSSKKTMFSLSERIELTKSVLSNLDNVEIIGYSNLTIDFLKEQQIDIMVRGLRNIIDYEYEQQLANAYLSQLPHLEIIFLNTKLNYSYISSTIVKDIASHNGNIEQYVPPEVKGAVIDKIKKLQKK